MHTEAHEFSGKEVTLKADFKHHEGDRAKGHKFRIEDWQDKVFGGSWMFASGNPACIVYAMRSAAAGLPTDDDCVYAHDERGIGHIIHSSEIDYDSR